MFKLFHSPAILALALLLSAPVMATAQSSSARAKSAATGAPAIGDKLDINTATVDQLKALPGVGDAYAKRIVDGRPYTAKNQLTTRGILPAATYSKIQNQIIASKSKR